MKTNFFTTLAPMIGAGMNLTLTIKKDGDNLIVGVRPQLSEVNEKVSSKITPLVLTHPAETLDEGFFETIIQPMEKVDQLGVFLKNIEEVEKEAKEEADKKKSSPAKKTEPKKVEKKEEPKKEKDPVQEAYLEAKAYIQAANGFIKAGKEVRAIDELAKAEKLLEKLPETGAEHPAIKDAIHGAKVELEQQKQEALNKELEKEFEVMTAKIKALNYPEGVKMLFKILEKNPQHEGSKKLHADLIEKFGEVTLNQLAKS